MSEFDERLRAELDARSTREEQERRNRERFLEARNDPARREQARREVAAVVLEAVTALEAAGIRPTYGGRWYRRDRTWHLRSYFYVHSTGALDLTANRRHVSFDEVIGMLAAEPDDPDLATPRLLRTASGKIWYYPEHAGGYSESPEQLPGEWLSTMLAIWVADAISRNQADGGSNGRPGR